jgi:hypothetical protein
MLLNIDHRLIPITVRILRYLEPTSTVNGYVKFVLATLGPVRAGNSVTVKYNLEMPILF